MKLTYKIPSIDYQIDHILNFINEDVSDWWLEGFNHFYQEIPWNELKTIPEADKRRTLMNHLVPYYESIQSELNLKVVAYQKYWDTHQQAITHSFEKAFQMNLQDKFEDMVGYLSLNPICPRFIETRSFDVFHLSSEYGAMGIALHEIIHFVWFEVWHDLFKDDKTNYETPHLVWVFSEMVVDCIMKDEHLTALNPYAKNNKVVYDYFYDIIIDQVCILDTLNELYLINNIHDFMKKGFEYCQTHEQLIRSKMK